MYLEKIKRIRGLILFTVFVLVLFWNYELLFSGIRFLWKVFLPFVAGLGIAFVLNLPMQFWERKVLKKCKRGKRHLSLILTVITVGGAVLAVAIFLLPELGKTFAQFGKNMNLLLPQLQKKIVGLLRGQPELAKAVEEMDVRWETVSKQLIRFLKSGMTDAFSSTMETVKSIISGVTGFVIGFVFACYVLLQKERLARQAKKILYAFLPKDWTEILIAFGELSNEIFSKFLSGQCLEAILLGGMFFAVLLLLKIPYALLISTVITITAFIPIFGAFIGCAVGTILIVTVNPLKVVLFLIVFLVLQEVEGDFIYPHVVGKSVGLPPIWVLFSVTVGAGIMGVVGMILFIPIASVLYSMLKGIVHRRLRRRGITVEEKAYIVDK